MFPLQKKIEMDVKTFRRPRMDVSYPHPPTLWELYYCVLMQTNGVFSPIP